MIGALVGLVVSVGVWIVLWRNEVESRRFHQMVAAHEAKHAATYRELIASLPTDQEVTS